MDDSSPPPIGGVGPEVYEAALPGVVRVEAGLHKGGAFAVGPGELVTAAHVVRDAYEINVVLPGSEDVVEARLVGYDETIDLALLSIPDDIDVKPLALGSQPDAVAPGLEVWTIGHPGGRAWAIAKGVVNSFNPEDAELVTSLSVANGSSGGPVLRYLGEGQVEVVGVVSRILSGDDAEASGAVPASVVAGALPELRQGVHRGWSDASGFVRTVHNRSPLVHQMILARRVQLGGNEVLEDIHDTLTQPSFPASETLELRTTWRYFFAGVHTFQYRVNMVGTDGSLETIHEGPLRTFTLSDERDSFVHNVEIDIDFEKAGEYLITVLTDGGVSAITPLRVVERGKEYTPTSGMIDAIGYQRAPLHHALIVAREIRGKDGKSTVPGAGSGQTLLPVPNLATPITIEGSFNTVRLERFPSTVRFRTWTRWGYGFTGDHDFGLALVDSSGRFVVAQGDVPGVGIREDDPVAADTREQYTFSLADDMSSYFHVAWWEVSLESAGLYFVLVYTDGTITRALPIWVEETR